MQCKTDSQFKNYSLREMKQPHVLNATSASEFGHSFYSLIWLVHKLNRHKIPNHLSILPPNDATRALPSWYQSVNHISLKTRKSFKTTVLIYPPLQKHILTSFLYFKS